MAVGVVLVVLWFIDNDGDSHFHAFFVLFSPPVCCSIYYRSLLLINVLRYSGWVVTVGQYSGSVIWNSTMK